MDENKVKQLIEDALNDREERNLYQVAKTPYHTHNGIDSPVLPPTASLAAGANTQIQFNNNGVPSGSNNLTFVDPNLTVGGSTGGSIIVNGSLEITKGPASFARSYFVDKGWWVQAQYTVNTTNATPTTIMSVAPATSGAILVEAHIYAERTGGSGGSAHDSAGYIRYGLYKMVGTTPALVGSITDAFTAESQAGWDITFTTTSTDIVIQVTGAANNNVTWNANVFFYSDSIV